MGDVADILGLAGPPSSSGRASPALGDPLGPLQENKRGKGVVGPLKRGKPQGVSREVYALLGSDGLPPEVRMDATRTLAAVIVLCNACSCTLALETMASHDHGYGHCCCLIRRCCLRAHRLLYTMIRVRVSLMLLLVLLLQYSRESSSCE